MLPGFLVPLLLAGGGDTALAHAAAHAAIAGAAAPGPDAAALLTLTRMVGYALAELDALRLSAAVSLTMKLKLRGNANALNRSAQRMTEALAAGRHAAAAADPREAVDEAAVLAALDAAQAMLRQATAAPSDAPAAAARAAAAPAEPIAVPPAPGEPAPDEPGPDAPRPSEPGPSEPGPGERATNEAMPRDPAPADAGLDRSTPAAPTPADPAPGEPTPGEPSPTTAVPPAPSRHRGAMTAAAQMTAAHPAPAPVMAGGALPCVLGRPRSTALPPPVPQRVASHPRGPGQSPATPAPKAPVPHAAAILRSAAPPASHAHNRLWAKAMTDVAEECRANLCRLAPAQRRLELLRIEALTTTALTLGSGLPAMPALRRADLLASTAMPTPPPAMAPFVSGTQRTSGQAMITDSPTRS